MIRAAAVKGREQLAIRQDVVCRKHGRNNPSSSSTPAGVLECEYRVQIRSIPPRPKRPTPREPLYPPSGTESRTTRNWIAAPRERPSWR